VDVEKWSDATISVLVCDDVAHWRRLLTVALETSPAIEVMAEVDDGDAVLGQVSESAPDVVWLGLRMSGPGAPRLTAAIRELVPSARVAVVANPEEADLRLRALRAGATGIVGRASAAATAVSVTERLAWGRCVVEPEDVARLLETYAGLNRQASSVQQQLVAPVLTARDRDVLARMALGESGDEVARVLGLAPATVDQTLAQVVGRLHRYTRTEAVVYAVGERLFEPG